MAAASSPGIEAGLPAGPQTGTKDGTGHEGASDAGGGIGALAVAGPVVGVGLGPGIDGGGSGPPSVVPLPRVVRLMAAAAGLIGANVHYSQPLIPVIALSVGISTDAAGFLPALSQIGFAIGLLAVLPLGDLLERRRLITSTVWLAVGALILMALAPNLPVLMIAAFGVGLFSVAPQLLSPFAADIAPPGRQGQASGLVISGILFGVLFSKIVAGAVAATAGWRWLYAAAAVTLVVLAIVLQRALPESRPTDPPRYLTLMRSLGQLVVLHPRLRLHALLGAASSALFMTFWSTYAVHLSDRFGYGPFQAGLFGVAGIAGSLLAPLAGKAIDRGRFGATVSIALCAILAAFVILLVSGGSWMLIALGAIILDAGVGVSHAANQAAALRLDPARRSRVNSIYMFGYFAGGALGTAAAGLASGQWGWNGVCGFGLGLAGFTVVGFLISGAARVRR
jgi:predicted MFS family arabinose efflux permease